MLCCSYIEVVHSLLSDDCRYLLEVFDYDKNARNCTGNNYQVLVKINILVHIVTSECLCFLISLFTLLKRATISFFNLFNFFNF